MNKTQINEKADYLIKKSKKAGAEDVDVVYVENTNIDVGCRLKKIEKLERSESNDLGLRFIKNKKQVIVSSNDLSNKSLEELVYKASNMVKAVPKDPYCSIAEKKDLIKKIPNLNILENKEPSINSLKNKVIEAEKAGLNVNGVTNSEGSEIGWNKSKIHLFNSNGLNVNYQSSNYSIYVVLIAGKGTSMEREYEFASSVSEKDLIKPSIVGKKAGEKAVKRLKPRKIKTSKIPVIFSPRVANSFLRYLSSSINGNSIARGTSFLKKKLNKKIFSENINIVDNPLKKGGLQSKPFDGEGLETKKTEIVKNGELKTWILDLSTAKQLKLKSTGHASRGISSPPSPNPTNLYFEPGNISKKNLIGNIKKGIYLTELMGSSVNLINGDYSRGGSGFWIDKGEITYPINEITIADNLNEMFKRIILADDLEFKQGLNSPTMLIENMTVAG
ncbi:MAG: Metalloprotease PmbA [Alphaproteobacteria bacterium MarineAlpha6_Bin6]|nr:modulator protein [Pelagibacteraceae bacterium]PPR28999.1 MAG: Metalloprotease PmbA [Alphaproteobacteria bacterium MarineAlpha6_Bin6]PPR33562.1 MAG: Metalloprotease PmbA [Alphaproteobacteria bacterium MarineAlpha6_Bin5]|tara:strand:- start:4861 stop:6198 length:1338 start_codon:yes stop_codon:yes gene_type:complete